METITVRRWVTAGPELVWQHLFDLQRLVIEDPTLDLDHLVGEDADTRTPAIGTVATVSRRRGNRVERVELHVEDRHEPAHLSVTITSSGERWTLRVTVEPLPCGGSDVRFHAERDPIGIRRLDPRGASGRSHRVAHRISLLLDGLAQQLDDLRQDVRA